MRLLSLRLGRRRFLAGTLFAAGAGVVGGLAPLVPRLVRRSVVQTQLQRVDFTSASQLARGSFDGPITLVEHDARPVLALTDSGTGIFVSPPIELDLVASSLAAHWTQPRERGSAVSFAVRASQDGQIWTAWQDLHGEGGADTGAHRRVFSALLAVAGTRFAQFRFSLACAGSDLPVVSDVSLFALNSATAPRRTELTLRFEPAGRALATIEPLGIVSREQWGADESLRFELSDGQMAGKIWPEEVQQVEKVVVHHSAGSNVCASKEVYCQQRSVIAVNDIYHYHTVVNGWGDIGYNSLIGYDGRIYEGRHGPEPLGDKEPLPEPVVAGHALGFNNRTHGIAVMGDFQEESVPDHQYEALATMIGWIVKSRLAAQGEIDPFGARDYVTNDGTIAVGLPNIIGHRDVNDTECPGDFLYARLPDLRDRAKRLVEWPPLHVELQARPSGDTITYHIFVQNHEPDVVKGLVVKGAIPPTAQYVDSWAGSPTHNHGVFDGSVVTWLDADTQVAPGRDRREYAFVVRPRPGVARADVRTTAWVEFAKPAPGRAMSEVVSADQPIVLTADRVIGGTTGWTGEWPESRNVEGYFGDGYQVHAAAGGRTQYTWEVKLPEAGLWEVAAWWTAAPDRATNAPYTIHAQDGPRTVQVNQQESGARWVSLGTFAFPAGAARVSLSDDADGFVIADAVRFRKR